MWFHRLLGFRARLLLVLLIPVSACKKGAPSPTAPAIELPREVTKDSTLLFTYVEPTGMFATTDKAEKVPEVARRLVRIMGLGNGEPRRLNNTNVEVIDLRELLAKGKTRPQVMLREAFESGALAQLPPGDSCTLAGSRGPGLAEEPEAATPADEPPIVILYGTRWCKACKSARQYLVSHRVPFASKDIEKDPSAALELEKKASPFGIPVDRVPILDVRGRLLVGYDETRLDGFLADW
jgi:glutaredoxin